MYYVYSLEWKNGDIYYGSTSRQKQRKYEHLTRLRGGYHENTALQNHYNTHGEPVYTVLSEHKTIEDARSTEHKYITESSDGFILNRRGSIPYHYVPVDPKEKKERLHIKRFGYTQAEGELVEKWFLDYQKGIHKPWPIER